MREGYCSCLVCMCVCLSVCVSVCNSSDDDCRHTTAATPVASDGISAAICNLLPGRGAAKGVATSAGIYVGEGLLPVPAKLADRIQRWEFVDMAELLPEFWGSTSGKEASQPSTSRAASARRKRAVTDIATWVQCFATYISVMSTSHPGQSPSCWHT